MDSRITPSFPWLPPDRNSVLPQDRCDEFSNGFDRLLGVQGCLIQADQGAFRISSGFKHVTSVNFRKSRS
jgi:hypothetical protein